MLPKWEENLDIVYNKLLSYPKVFLVRFATYKFLIKAVKYIIYYATTQFKKYIFLQRNYRDFLGT